jgi:hypothetical protein
MAVFCTMPQTILRATEYIKNIPGGTFKIHEDYTKRGNLMEP